MKFKCPKCGQAILTEDINIQTDLALCRSCQQVSRPSELADDDFNTAALTDPPKGAWFRQTMNETVIGATTRSPVAFFLVPFMCIWSGASIGGIYGTQIMKGQFNPLLSLLGIPFLMGSLLFWSVALMAICGKVEVRLRGRQGVIFTGVGALGWKRPIDLNDVNSITESPWAVNYPGNHRGGILLDGRKRLRFASNVSEARRIFILNALKSIKAGSDHSPRR